MIWFGHEHEVGWGGRVDLEKDCAASSRCSRGMGNAWWELGRVAGAESHTTARVANRDRAGQDDVHGFAARMQVVAPWRASGIELDHVNVEVRSILGREKRHLAAAPAGEFFGIPVPASKNLG